MTVSRRFWGFALVIGIIAACQVFGAVAALLGGDGAHWTEVAYAMAVGVLCALVVRA